MPRSLAACFAAWTLALLALPSAAHSAEVERKLAVLEFEVAKGVEIDRRTFSSRLQNAARRAAPGLFVMTQANIEMLVRAAGKTLEQCEGQCAVDTGKLIGADLVIAGRISKVGRTFALSMQLYDTARGELLAGEDAEAKSDEELLQVSASAAERLLAPLRPKQAGPKPQGQRSAGTESKIDESGAQVDLGGGGDEVLVKIDSNPPGANARADGALLCQSTPCSKMMTTGAHEVSFEKEGYEGAPQRVQVKKGTVITGQLARIAATLAVNSEPSGLPISVDGEKAGASPVARRELAPGTHEVVVDDPCWLRTGEKVVLKKGEDRTLQIAGKQRQAGLKLTAEDERGNAVEARAKLDGRDLGAVPGSFTVPYCAKALVVEAADTGAEQTLALQEGKVSALKLVLKRRCPPNSNWNAATAQCQCIAGTVWDVAAGRCDKPKYGVEFVALPGGTLKGGNFNGQRVAPFSLAPTATTVEQYEKCVTAGACSEPNTGGTCNWKTDRRNHPVNCVDWNQATAFCKWAGGRLPTAEEREWAASSGKGWTYPWGNEEPGARACWDGEGSDVGKGNRKTTCVVGSHSAGASRQGIQDLAGNVWEWLSNDSGSGKELRGGSWGDGDPDLLRAADRNGDAPTNRNNLIGLRCGL